MSANILDLNNLRLAVLIDAENVPRNCIKSVMEEIAIYGTPTIKRIYGDWTSPVVSGWKNSLLVNAITPVQQYSYTTGKNSSDSAMIIDAMDILYSERTDGFVIVSSDSDFTRLAIRLREAGQRVIGIGERKTPGAFIAACDKFTYIEVIRAKAVEARIENDDAPVESDEIPAENEDASVEKGEPRSGSGAAYAENKGANGESSRAQADSSATGGGATGYRDDTTGGGATGFDDNQSGSDIGGEQKNQSQHPGKHHGPSRQKGVKIPGAIVQLIADSVADLAGDSGSVFMGELGNLLLKKQPDFDHRNFGYKSLSSMIKTIDRFETEFRQTTDPNIKHVFVRDKESG